MILELIDEDEFHQMEYPAPASEIPEGVEYLVVTFPNEQAITDSYIQELEAEASQVWAIVDGDFTYPDS